MDIKKLYTDRAQLYEMLFCKTLRYTKGLACFFNTNNIIHSNMKILDAGCGSGTAIKALYTIASKKNLTNVRFNGFDLTPAMLNLFSQWIKRNNNYSITLQQADIIEGPRLPTEWNNYDLIVSSAMLEYLTPKQLSPILKKLMQLLKKNGMLLIFISKNNLFNKIVIKKWWHSHLYEKEKIEHILKQVDSSQYTFLQFPLPYYHLNLWGHCIQIKK